jgi:hypothetical protein
VQGGIKFGHGLVVAGGDPLFDGAVSKVIGLSESALDETACSEIGT